MINFIRKYNILNPSQHGFLPNKSIESASYQCLNYIFRNIDDGKHVVTIFFDLSIAFDTINSSFLFTKLYNLGIRGTLLKWIESYVSNRKMSVKCDGVISETRETKLGVPQGSVLGPLLFVLYVNDLFRNIKSGHVTMYADDTTVVVTADGVDDLYAITSDVCS